MAFVYKSEKIIGKEITNTDLGPGQYLPQGIPRKLKPAKAPFNSITFRSKLTKKDEVPGPGSYEFDEKIDKFASIFQDKSKKSESSLRYMELNGSENLDPFTIIINRENKRESGFLSKEKRFKELIKPGDIPAPGFYEKHDPLLLVKNSIKTKKKKDLKVPEKSKLSFMRYERSKGSPNRFVTIPSKNYSFGYDIKANGDIILKDDPEKYIKFKGEGNDTVGPGSYETVKPQHWKKNIVSWEKFNKTSIDIRENLLNNSSELFCNNNIDGNINNNESLKDIHKGYLNDINNNNHIKDKDKIIDNNMISSKNDLIIIKGKQKDIKDKVLKHIKNKRQKLFEIKKEKTENEDDLFSRNTLYQDPGPGPGYYNMEIATTGFRKKEIHEKFQTFGTSQIRFQETGFQDIGPGSYFKDDQRLEKIKLKKYLNEKLNFSTTILSQRDEIKKERSADMDQRLGINGLLNKQKIFNDNSLPGPGFYETGTSSFQPKNVNSTFSQSGSCSFGSIQRRFNNEIPFCETTPGPGSYLGLPKNQGSSILGTLHKLISKNKKLLTDDEISRSPEIKIDVKRNYERNTGTKISKDTVPSVGHYNLDVLFSMGYKVAKNVNKFNSKSAPFNSVEKRFFNSNKNNGSGNIGPGQYFKENKNEKILNYNSSPPFNVSSERSYFAETKNEFKTNGPGSYNTGSYFDWNKKSYNIQFL
jgi:hypothetical protein